MSRWTIDHFQVRTLVAMLRSQCDLYLTLTQSDAGTKSIVNEMRKTVLSLTKEMEEPQTTPEGFVVEEVQTDRGVFVAVHFDTGVASTVVTDGDTQAAVEWLSRELASKDVEE